MEISFTQDPKTCYHLLEILCLRLEYAHKEGGKDINTSQQLYYSTYHPPLKVKPN